MLSWTAGHSDVNEAPLKYVAEIRLGKMLQSAPGPNSDVEVPYIKATHVSWSGVDTSALPRMYASPREIELYGVRAGDLLVCEGGEAGRSSIVGELSTPTIVQNAVHRVRSTKVDLRYLKYCMEAVSASGWFDILTNKATIAHLTAEKLRSLRIPYRSLRSQQLIADLLDRETQRIDALVDAKRRMIDRLAEKSATLIRLRTTKGVTTATLRMTELPWVGSVPEHWPVRRLGHVASVLNGTGFPDRMQGNEQGEYPFYKVSDMNAPGNQWLLSSAANWVDRGTVSDLGGTIIPAGSVVFPKVGAALLTNKRRVTTRDCLVDNNCMALHFRVGLAQYWTMLLRGLDFGSIVQHGPVPSVNATQVKELRIPVPPLKEQSEIVQVVERETRRIDAAMSALGTQLVLLAEYRQALITKAVTGQLDEATLKGKKLPDEVVRV